MQVRVQQAWVVGTSDMDHTVQLAISRVLILSTHT